MLGRIIGSYHAEQGKGLPIGALTSQHFANYYLDGADRFLLEQLKVRAQVRYMDDTLFWCNSRAEAHEKLAALRDYLHRERQLQLKPHSQINRSMMGVSYCGYRIFPHAILLSRRKRQRYQQLRQQWERAWQQGQITALALQQAYHSAHAMTLHADSLAWRKQNLQLYPPPAIDTHG